jgi:ATP phosphoribosyltransferase
MAEPRPRLSLVLPNGALERSALEMFQAAGIAIDPLIDPESHLAAADPRIRRVRFLRPQEIPDYVQRGLFDFGLTGCDWIEETGADVVRLAELPYLHQASGSIRVVLAVPAEAPWKSVTDLPEGVRIATEFPELTRRFLASRALSASVTASVGAGEMKVPDIVDAVVAVVAEPSPDLGELRILDTLLTGCAELIAHPQSLLEPGKRQAIDDIVLLLGSAMRSRGMALVKFTVRAPDLGPALATLPPRLRAAVIPLADGRAKSVEVLVPKQMVNAVIPALRAAGARLILQIPVSRIAQ